MSISPGGVVVLEESPCPRESSRTNFQVLVLGSQVLDNNTVDGDIHISVIIFQVVCLAC